MRVSVPTFSVEAGNVVDCQCDILALKYAQGWYGADAAIAKRLGLLFDSGPAPGSFMALESRGKIPAKCVLFEGLPALKFLSYGTVRQFGRRVIEHAHQDHPHTASLAMTLHGVSVGLDERETFLSQLGGVVEALKAGALPNLTRVVFVELNKRRVDRLKVVLSENYPVIQQKEVAPQVAPTPIQQPVEEREKPHIFVAMPFTEGMEDVFIFGIQSPVQAAGFLCERVDMAIFSGDILERIKSRIETSYLVIADLTGANANVYLEVGYAWGKKKDTLLLCRNVDDLKFDVRGQRCVIYSSINDLNKKLAEELRLRVSSGLAVN